jgi:hypothetical protein
MIKLIKNIICVVMYKTKMVTTETTTKSTPTKKITTEGYQLLLRRIYKASFDSFAKMYQTFGKILFT